MSRTESQAPDRWQFFADAAREWRWKQIQSGGRVLQAARFAFPFFEDCVADARKHGYAGQACRTQGGPAAAKRELPVLSPRA